MKCPDCGEGNFAFAKTCSHCKRPLSPKAVGESSKPQEQPAAQVSGRVPGNYYSFEFLVEVHLHDADHIGCPCFAISTPIGVRWGPKIEWSWPDPSKPRVRWVDDPLRGLASRILKSSDDAVGAEGTIGDMHVRFESILDAGKNQVVYAFYCPEKNIRFAYGFSRSMCENDSSR